MTIAVKIEEEFGLVMPSKHRLLAVSKNSVPTVATSGRRSEEPGGGAPSTCDDGTGVGAGNRPEEITT